MGRDWAVDCTPNGVEMIRMSMPQLYRMQVTNYLPAQIILQKHSDSGNDMRIENTVQIYSNTPAVTAKLEQAFLEEMMKYIIPEASNGEFSGGIGEEQFSSFLTREYADAISTSLDLGLKVSRDG